MFNVAIITCSDKGSQGLREDMSGRVIKELSIEMGYKLVSYMVIPDDLETIAKTLCKMVDEMQADLVLTTGGTGFSPKDVTPEATMQVIHRQAPGIAEAMRYHSLIITPRAMLSRAIAGIRHQSLVVNLPGSPKAVREILEYIFPSLYHGLEILQGKTGECART